MTDLKGNSTNPTSFQKNSEYVGSGKYIPGSSNKTLANGSNTSNSTVFSTSYNSNKSLNSEMIKSSIHDNNPSTK